MREQWMRQAIALATENVRSGKGGPFGAVIVRDGQCVAEAANSVTADNDPTAHAEVNAIRQACRVLNSYTLEDCEIYTSCEPCPMCLAACYWSHLRSIYYANTREDAARAEFDDALLYREAAMPVEARTIPARNLLREEGWESFALWLEKADRIRY